jgi:hypothetical protein
VLDLLAFVLGLLGDFVIKFLLGEPFQWLQGLWNWTASKL